MRLPSKFVIVVTAAAAVLLLSASYIFHLDHLIRSRFDGKRWLLPAVIYARPLEIYPGLQLSSAQLVHELQLADYRREKQVISPGGYNQQGDTVKLFSRDFHFADGLQAAEPVTVKFSRGAITSLSRTDNGQSLSLVRLDPARIGSFHPRSHEDRIVLTRDELPDLLIKTLLAVEDQNFYSHSGFSLRGIFRALLANIRAGETVQGGSTLTQQLVKNFFLNNQRSLRRKINEAIMALLLEFHYSKDEILTAYVNEIFMGQDGSRAVHGFGLAARFYFRRDPADLDTGQIAVLVGMVKGPSYYNPLKNPKRCLKRRNLVLRLMREQGIIDEPNLQRAINTPIKIAARSTSGFNRFPAFLDLVRRRLRRDYRKEDLTTDGLTIITTLDPQAQLEVEARLKGTISRLEKHRRVKNIEGAVVVSRRENGEILAVAGGRDPIQNGFNRALDAHRSIGSLIKPVIYLTALENGYTLVDLIEDRELTIDDGKNGKWQPENFDKKTHGPVPLYQALAQSYNLATVKLGLDLGLKKIKQTYRRLGGNDNLQLYPSMLLGAIDMSPLEVSRLYQTLAAGGFLVPQRAIDTVLSADHKVLSRFSLSVEQRVDSEPVYLLNTALQEAVRQGTGKSLAAYVADSCKVAGKTGTSNDLRDSWFAGFTGDMLCVVWLGRDDNKPTGLTGATGALQVWGEIIAGLQVKPLDLPPPPDIKWAWFDPDTLELSTRFARSRIKLPFIAGTVQPGQPERPGADRTPIKGFFDRIFGWFD